MGRAALEGLRGVRSVETGLSRGQETDRVEFDPRVVSVEEMERALRRAGTFRATLAP